MEVSVLALLTTVLVNAQDVVSKDRGDVTRIVKELSNRSLMIILFDEQNEKLASAVSNIKVVNKRFLIFNVDNTRSFLHQHLDHVLTTATSVDDFRDNLRFLVVCSDCLRRVVSMASEADNAVGQHTLRHFSTWLFLTQNRVLELEISFDNIAWSRVEDMESPDVQRTLFTSDQKVSTLLWMPEGRKWSEVCISDVENEDVLHQTFPNIKRGLNGKQLKISTLQRLAKFIQRGRRPMTLMHTSLLSVPDMFNGVKVWAHCWPWYSMDAVLLDVSTNDSCRWIPQAIRKVVNGTVSYVGASIEYIQFLSHVFNFTYRVVEPEDGIWGVRMENGSWTGVTGMVQRGEADFTGCPYAISASRTEFMDFTPPVYTTEFVVIYARTRSAEYFWTFLLRGLSWEVYLCSGIMLLCSILLYMCILHIIDNDGEIQSRWTKMNIFFTFAGISVRQDIPPVFKFVSSSGRVLVFSWVFFCLLITAMYSGCFVANVTVDRFEVPFATLQDLADQDEYLVSSYEGLVPLEIMENAKHGVYQKLYVKAEKHVLNTTSTYLEDGLHRILNDRYALIASTRSYWTMRANSCEIHYMRERFVSTWASFGFPRRSPLVKLFHDTWMLDTGLSEKKQKQWLPAPKPCEQRVMTNQFKLEHLKSLFVACVIGIGLGAVTLVLEKLRN